MRSVSTTSLESIGSLPLEWIVNKELIFCSNGKNSQRLWMHSDCRQSQAAFRNESANNESANGENSELVCSFDERKADVLVSDSGLVYDND